jgi:Meiotically up-regulated gene 113
MIYFVQGEVTRLVKIGWSLNVEKRLRQMQTGSAERLKVIAKMPGDEKHFHQMFAKRRFHGEWFSLTDEMLAFGVTEGMGCDTTLIMLRGWKACENIFQERGEKAVIRAVRAAARYLLAVPTAARRRLSTLAVKGQSDAI